MPPTRTSAGDRAGRAPYPLHDGVLWPVLASFTVFVLALPILMPARYVNLPAWRPPRRGGKSWVVLSLQPVH
jgi:hypothetical protein